jgi:hypothetical protein
MDGHDGIHGVLFLAEHGFQLVVPDDLLQQIRLILDFLQEGRVFFLGSQREQDFQIIQCGGSVPPLEKRVLQPAFFSQDILGLLLVVPEGFMQGKFFEGFDLIFDFLDVKDTPLTDRFFFANRLLCR